MNPKETTTMTNKQGPTQSSNLTSEDEGIKTFDAYDFGLAAALLTLGYELLVVHELENCNHLVFHFVFTPNIGCDKEAYYNGKLHVDANHYFYKLNNLQARLNGVLHDED